MNSKKFFGTFKPGEYIRITGTVGGELQITEAIPDIDKANSKGTGKVQYLTDYS